ncbi:type VII secretion-associated serine protease mycosin [Saccharothrix obliqua]|uniref:type VII secretion-associated serine protease mycosin n=1 Tax=Saccharothrix obliqua TaxID=2861747 RepID=UPI001C5F0F90|nr:type VII secretion-associated serine protease mycosin [Saccharothrix obliqua]MBW4716000.1 type VII secretion-associated serine protease mycosin [Saccharothrix obliqua]
MNRTARKLAAATAVALTLVGAPGAQAQEQAKSNSTPPPVDRGYLKPFKPPAEDVDYAQKTQCVRSGTGNRPIPNKPWGQMQLRLEEAHRFATGAGVKIGIIDTGVNADHPRLRGRVTSGGDYVETEKGGTSDCDGHGTEVAGIAAASRDEQTGFVGAAPDAEVVAYRQTSSHFEYKDPANRDNRPSAGKVRTLAEAIVAAATAGVRVINISLTSCELPNAPSEQERELQAAIDWAVNDKDVVIVTAAGNVEPDDGCSVQNDNQDPDHVNIVASPGWYADNVLSVASMSEKGTVSSFSVWGPWVSVAAPGEQITTLDPAGEGLSDARVDEKGTPSPLQGTSYASPYVAGVVALVRQRFPDLTAHQVMDRVKATAQHPGNPGGRDHKVGAGMINPIAALTAELPSEKGVKPADPPQLMTDLDPLNPPDHTPLIVALSGTGAGVGLLLLTLFIVHTVNRNRARRTTPVRRSVI